NDEEAVAALNRAWDAGERSAAISEALGEARMRLYLAAFREAGAIRDEELRRVELARIETELRAPAEAQLARAGREATDPRLAIILLDHLRGADGVEARLEALAPELAWPVDAMLFAAELAQRDARLAHGKGDNPAALQWLGAAERHYRASGDIARSHPAAMAGICRLTSDLASLRRYGGDVPQARIDGAYTACDRAISLDSGRAQSFAAKAVA